MQECCRNCAILENLFVLEKLVLKFKHNPNVFKTNFVSWTGTQHLKNFSKLSLMKKNVMYQRRNRRLSDIRDGSIPQLKTLLQKAKTLSKINATKMTIRRDLIELGNCERKQLSKKGKTFHKRF